MLIAAIFAAAGVIGTTQLIWLGNILSVLSCSTDRLCSFALVP